MAWQVQEAKQRFSEVLRRAQEEGPQVVTRHGQEVAVIVDAAEYKRLAGTRPDLKEFLLSGPYFDDLEIDRPRDLMREVEL